MSSCRGRRCRRYGHGWHAFKIGVLRVDGLIREITTFDPALVGAFGHPDVLDPPNTTDELR